MICDSLAGVSGPAPVVYGLDAAGFIQQVAELLTGNVAGFSARLTEDGSTIGLTGQNWAKEPQDGSEAWTPDIRMHVASPSKIVTAIAMTNFWVRPGSRRTRRSSATCPATGSRALTSAISRSPGC